MSSIFVFDTQEVIAQAGEFFVIFVPLIVLGLGLKYGGRIASAFRRQ